MKVRIALALALVACGARTDLGKKSVDGGVAACVTEPAPAAPCTRWTLGTPQVILPPLADPNRAFELAAIVGTGCGALVAWYIIGPEGSTTVWGTRLVGFDGVPLADTVDHPSLGAQTDASAGMTIAWNGSRAGATVVDESSCRFIALDAGGHELAGPVPLDGSGFCGEIAVAGSGFTYLDAASESTPASLTTLDASGVASGSVDLALPSGQALWSRLAFDDGSFLLHTFAEDSVTQAYTAWLAPFDAKGAPLGPQVVVSAANTAPVWLAATKTGALSEWSWDAAYVQPVDRHGAPTGPVVNVTGPQTIYATAIASVPDGDVFFAWDELAATKFTRWVVALAPDGTPRGPATPIATDTDDAEMFVAVESTGARALIVTSTSAGIQTWPLRCE